MNFKQFRIKQTFNFTIFLIAFKQIILNIYAICSEKKFPVKNYSKILWAFQNFLSVKCETGVVHI